MFGLVAVSLMLIFYALEDRSPRFVLAFAGACLMGSAYGFLQGAWPFGLVEGVWSIVALRRWVLLCSARPVGNVDGLLADLLTITRQTEPMIYAFMDDAGATRGFVQIYRPGRGQILIQRLWTVVHRQGHGSHILRTLCELADRHGVRMRLKAQPIGPQPLPMSVQALREWYHRYGFVGTAKRMWREPSARTMDVLVAGTNGQPVNI